MRYLTILMGMAIPAMAMAQSVGWHTSTDNDFWQQKKNLKLEAHAAQTPLLSISPKDRPHRARP